MNYFLQTRKRFACIVMMLVLVCITKAQTPADSVQTKKEKLRCGLSFSAGFRYRQEVNLYPGLAVTLQKPKHLFSFGPVAWADSYGSYLGSGGEFCYQYYPKTNKNQINLYLFANSACLLYRNLHTYGYYNYQYKAYTTDITLKGSAGIGFRVNASRHFYFFEQNGIGISNTSILNKSNANYYQGESNYGAYGFFQLWAGFGFVFGKAAPLLPKPVSKKWENDKNQTRRDSVYAKKEKFKPGIAVSGMYKLHDDFNPYFSPVLTLQKSRHLISLGPVFSLGSKTIGNVRGDSTSSRNAGAECIYQFYPRTNRSTLNVYLLAGASYMVSRYSLPEPNNPYAYPSSYTSFSGYSYTLHKIRDTELKAGGGFGLRANVTRWLYLFEQNMIGINYSRSKHFNSQQVLISNTSNPNGFFQASAGLGIVF